MSPNVLSTGQQLPYLSHTAPIGMPLAPNSELVVPRPLELLGELQKLWVPQMNVSSDFNPSLAAAMMSMSNGSLDNFGLHYLANTSLSTYNPMLSMNPLGGLLSLAPGAMKPQQLVHPTIPLPQDSVIELNHPTSPTGRDSPTSSKKQKDKRLRFIEERFELPFSKTTPCSPFINY